MHTNIHNSLFAPLTNWRPERHWHDPDNRPKVLPPQFDQFAVSSQSQPPRCPPQLLCSPPRPAKQTHHCSPQQDALSFSPFPPKSPLSLPDACCRDTNVLLLLSSLSKHRQEGKRLTVCLVPYATWQQSLTDMARVWATAKGSFFFYLFYALLPCMCLCLGQKCETKSLSGPHQAGFTVMGPASAGRCFYRYLHNISDSTHDRPVETTDRWNNPYAAHLTFAGMRGLQVRKYFSRGEEKNILGSNNLLASLCPETC